MLSQIIQKSAKSLVHRDVWKIKEMSMDNPQQNAPSVKALIARKF